MNIDLVVDMYYRKYLERKTEKTAEMEELVIENGCSRCGRPVIDLLKRIQRNESIDENTIAGLNLDFLSDRHVISRLQMFLSNDSIDRNYIRSQLVYVVNNFGCRWQVPNLDMSDYDLDFEISPSPGEEDYLVCQSKSVRLGLPGRPMLDFGTYWMKFSMDKMPYIERLGAPLKNYAGYSHCHPHVNSNGELCTGDGRTIVINARNNFHLVDYFDLVNVLLASYNERSPYAHLETWYVPVCGSCEVEIIDNNAMNCRYCGMKLCPECQIHCCHCQRAYCGTCASVHMGKYIGCDCLTCGSCRDIYDRCINHRNPIERNANV